MRNAMPMRWIEQREARQVLADSRFERAPAAPWRQNAGALAAEWLPRLGAWLAARHPIAWLASEARPVLEPATVRRNYRPLDSDDYRRY